MGTRESCPGTGHRHVPSVTPSPRRSPAAEYRAGCGRHRGSLDAACTRSAARSGQPLSGARHGHRDEERPARTPRTLTSGTAPPKAANCAWTMSSSPPPHPLLLPPLIHTPHSLLPTHFIFLYTHLFPSHYPRSGPSTRGWCCACWWRPATSRRSKWPCVAKSARSAGPRNGPASAPGCSAGTWTDSAPSPRQPAGARGGRTLTRPGRLIGRPSVAAFLHAPRAGRAETPRCAPSPAARPRCPG